MSGQKHTFHRTLYFRVICGIVIGVAVGSLFPATAQALKPLGDAFIKLIVQDEMGASYSWTVSYFNTLEIIQR